MMSTSSDFETVVKVCQNVVNVPANTRCWVPFPVESHRTTVAAAAAVSSHDDVLASMTSLTFNHGRRLALQLRLSSRNIRVLGVNSRNHCTTAIARLS